jgi:hypothetical protein
MREAVSIMARVSAKCVVSRNRGHIVIHEPREKHVRALPGVRTQCDRLLNPTSDALPRTEASGGYSRFRDRLTASTA